MITFTVDKSCFFKSLQSVISVADKRHINPIFNNILIKVTNTMLFLIAFDSETEIITTVNLSLSSVSSEVCFTLPARKIFNITRYFPDNSKINFIYENNFRVTLSSGLSKFVLFSLDPKSFPILNEDTGNIIFKIPSINLLKLLKRVYFAMANNDFRYFLNGMLWELDNNKFKVIATDGYRMACSMTIVETVRIKKYLHIIIPRKSILELQKTITNYNGFAEISIGSNHFKLSLANYQFISKLIDASYPDYRCVIPRNNSRHVSINKSDLKSALMRIAILSHEQYYSVRLIIIGNKLLLSSYNSENEQAEDIVPIKYVGDKIEIGFNISYLLDVINVIKTNIIDLYFGDPSMSVIIKDKISNSIYVISPIKL